MFDKELLKRMKYSRCECPVDVRPSLGIVNGVCPRHSGSRLLIDGVPVEIYGRVLEAKKKKVENTDSDRV